MTMVCPLVPMSTPSTNTNEELIRNILSTTVDLVESEEKLETAVPGEQSNSTMKPAAAHQKGSDCDMMPGHASSTVRLMCRYNFPIQPLDNGHQSYLHRAQVA
jgi:hypothetical protein